MKRIHLLLLFLFFLNQLNAQWQQTNGPYVAGVNDFAKINSGILGATNFGFCITTDSGLNWSMLNTPNITNSILSLAAHGDTIIAGLDNQILFSVDDGYTWEESLSLNGCSFTTFLMTNNDKLFVISNCGIFLSEDQGLTWNAFDYGFNPVYSMPTCILVFGNKIIVGDYYNGILRSEDNGLTWNYGNDGLYCKSVLCAATINDSIYAGTSGGGVYLSTDYGNKWQSCSNGLFNYSVEALGVNNGKIYAGTQTGVFISEDRGKTWQDESEGLPPNCTVNAFTFINNEAFIGTVWNGIWRLNETNGFEELLINSSALNLYPNPASSDVTIELQLNTTWHLELSNLSGQILHQRSITGKSTVLDISFLPPGLYVVRLSNDKTVEVGKFMKE